MKNYKKQPAEKKLREMANEIIKRERLKTSATQIQFMSKRELLNFVSRYGHDELLDEYNPIHIFSLVKNDLLCAAVNGELDLLELAKETLASRGLNANNQWVGFNK
jgi:hypothetical protein